jgi:cytochrome c peroxidase
VSGKRSFAAIAWVRIAPFLLVLVLAPLVAFLGLRASVRAAAVPSIVSEWDKKALARLESPELGLPAVPVPVDNPPTLEKIALGRKLFFDRRLSFNNTMSCGMCHIPEQGFTNNELATPVGVEGRSIRRNSPTILNTAYTEHIFHDGREISLELQTLGPILARDEMANPSIGYVIAKLRELPDYQGLFEEAFGAGPSVERIGMAIASWERTVLAGDSPFDRWYYADEEDALTDRQKTGFELFSGKARCVTCHPIGPNSTMLTDDLFHNTGIGVVHLESRSAESDSVEVTIAPGQTVMVSRDYVRAVGEGKKPDLGRFEVTLDPADKWQFKTPSLRNVALTAPYMHNGSLRTLAEVIEFYDRGGNPHPELDPLIQPLSLDLAEKEALMAFLQSLTSPHVAALQEDARSVAVGN